MDRDSVDRWLEDYVEAWMTYDRERIAALFSDDVKYRYHPTTTPSRGGRR
jgi:ketosteroid isomerase-like protein